MFSNYLNIGALYSYSQSFFLRNAASVYPNANRIRHIDPFLGVRVNCGVFASTTSEVNSHAVRIAKDV
jgi:hypothetical protein